MPYFWGMLGTVPTFLAILGLVVLTTMLSYYTLRNKKQQVAAALQRLQELAAERKVLVAKYLQLNTTDFLEWRDFDDAHQLLHQQDQVLTRIDEAAVQANLDQEGIHAFTEHLTASQETMDELHQVSHQYKHLVTRKPNSYTAKIFGFKTALSDC